MFWQTRSLCTPLLCEVNLFTKFPECLGYYFIAYCCNFLHKYPQIIFYYRILIVTPMNRSKILQELSLQVLLVLWLVLVDVTVGHLSSLNYILVSLVFFHTFIIFGLCLWIASILWTLFPAYLSQYFCLGLVYPSSISIGIYAFFLQLQPNI